MREGSERGLSIGRPDRESTVEREGRRDRRDRAYRGETLYDETEGVGLQPGMSSERFKSDRNNRFVSCVSTISVDTDTENASNYSESLADSFSPMTRGRSLTEVSCMSDDDGDEVVVEGDEERNFRVRQILLELAKVDEND